MVGSIDFTAPIFALSNTRHCKGEEAPGAIPMASPQNIDNHCQIALREQLTRNDLLDVQRIDDRLAYK